MKIWPDMGQWRSAFAVALPALLIVAVLGFLGGWLSWDPVENIVPAIKLALILFIVPALLEELVFRGILLAWLARLTPRWAAWISTVLFVLWHPLQAVTIAPPWSAIFLQPTFLLAMLIFGVILSHIRIVTKSLWPVIIIHWIAVLVWKLLLGGPSL
ncbi:hypothetical protein MNBD_ALPHA04-1473 [hydrothermal vent metagenome]|uniref:CAAX prenyl protease 2/Lysostaphin resistance protein A-like domain-containing protein n=1 Tax=hydrothermal vent metagenome TaxID=652676 RepID=A0A3B0RF71_9ZZZZ